MLLIEKFLESFSYDTTRAISMLLTQMDFFPFIIFFLYYLTLIVSYKLIFSLPS